jgi:2-enoate reductase
LEQLKVNVKLNQNATSELISKYSPNVIIVATGSRSSVPDIEGMNRRKVIKCEDVLLEKAEVGRRVIVVGGGFVGCETAEFLIEKGRKVTIVEILPQLASELFFPYAYQMVQRLKERKIKFYTGVKSEAITERGMEITDVHGKKVFVDADDIILATGSKADQTLSQSLKEKFLRVIEVGDCREPARIYEAISEGAEAGLRV